MSIFKLQVKQKFAQEYNYGPTAGSAVNNIYTCVILQTDLKCHYVRKKGRIYELKMHIPYGPESPLKIIYSLYLHTFKGNYDNVVWREKKAENNLKAINYSSQENFEKNTKVKGK